MNTEEQAGTTDSIPAPKPGGWVVSILLGLAMTALYLANRAEPIGAEDTAPAEFLPSAIVRGDGPYLDRFMRILYPPTSLSMAWSMTRSRGHVVSRYAIGGVFVHTPIVAIQVAIRDRLSPGWDENLAWSFIFARRMTKVSSAILGALTAVVLHRLLRRLGLGRVAIVATLAAALGSNLWVTGSQATWEHGPAALMLTLAMFWLTPRPASRAGLLLGGLATAVMVCCRSIDLVFAVAITLRVAFERPRSLLWFLPGPIVVGAALFAYNLYFFDSLVGGHQQLETLHPILHGLGGPWSGELFAGMAGTLFSPNRGLLAFSPWIVLSLATLPAIRGRLRAWPVGPWLLGALVVDLLILSKYAVWWGGHSFGPRYWTDALPIFAVILGLALDWAHRRCRPLLIPFGLTIAFSTFLQAVGAWHYPSTWNFSPVDIDRLPARAWDWSDTEISRELRGGPRPWSEYPSTIRR